MLVKVECYEFECPRCVHREWTCSAVASYRLGDRAVPAAVRPQWCDNCSKVQPVEGFARDPSVYDALLQYAQSDPQGYEESEGHTLEQLCDSMAMFSSYDAPRRCFVCREAVGRFAESEHVFHRCGQRMQIVGLSFREDQLALEIAWPWS